MNKLLLLFLFFPLVSLAQPVLKVSRNAKFTYSKHDRAFFVLDDSTHYYTYKPAKARWQKHQLHVVLSDGYTFEDFKQRFYPLAIGKGHYLLVQDGCGMVYELKNDTIRRIDGSFDQKNQFSSALYTYQNKVFMFGGYGLFEVKNTHTYFDLNTKEWFQEYRQTHGCPSARSTPFYIRQQNQLFILGGIEQRFDKLKVFSDFWSYDHQKRTWQLLGELNPNFVLRTKIRGFVQNKDYRIFHYNNKLTIVDIAKNKYYSYSSDRYFNINRVIHDKNLNWVMVARHNANRGDFSLLKVQRLNSVLYGKPTEFYLYKPASFFKQVPLTTYLWLSILLNVALFFLIFYVQRLKKTSWYKPKRPQLERDDFTDLEWRILLMIKESGELELSALNDFFNEPGLSYETLKKRRESFIRALRIKLAMITRRDVEQLLQENKHPMDKRMKIIRWNNELEINLEE